MLIEALSRIGQVRHFPKRAFLFRQGDETRSLFLIQKGLLKAYYETIDGKEFIKSFVGEGGFIASMQAMVAAQPCSFTLVALEDATVIEVAQAAFRDLVAADLTGELNALLLALAMKKERREYEFLCMSPEQRYLAFREQEPDLVGRLAQQDIAGYLGITPVALSRIRKRCGLLGNGVN